MPKIFIVVSLIILGNVAIVLSVPDFFSSVVFIPLMLIIAVTLPVLRQSFRVNVDIFEPIYIVVWGYILLYVIAPILMVTLDVWSIPHLGDHYRLLSVALFYILLGILMMYLGYWSDIGGRMAAGVPPLRRVTARRMRIFAAIYGIIGLVCYFVFMDLAGGLYNFFANVGFRINFSSSRGYLLWGIMLIVHAISLWFATLLLKGNTSSIFNRALFALSFVVAIALFIILGNRARVLLFFFFPIAIYHYAKSAISMRAMLVLGLISFTLVAGPLHWFRTAPSGVRTDAALFAEFIHESSHKLLEDIPRNLGYIEVFMAIIERYPEHNNFVWGKTFAALLFSPLPRFLFPQLKPYGAATIVTNAIYPDLRPPDPTNPLDSHPGTGVVPTLTGELYMNFWVPGILAGMFVYGVLLRFLYVFFLKNRKNMGALVIYSFAIYGLIYALTLGDFVNGMATTMLFLFPLFIVFPFTGARAAEVFPGYGRPPQTMNGSSLRVS